MSKTVMYLSFNLAQGVSAPDFLKAAEKLNNEFISKQKGYISWTQLSEGDMWVDMLTWETAEDAHSAMAATETNALAMEFMAFIDGPSVKMHLLSVEKEHTKSK